MKKLAPGQIRRAAQILKSQRPAYENLLQCYEEIFVAQEECRSALDFAVPRPSENLLAIREKEALPLIGSDEFRFDTAAATDLMHRICRILQAQNPQLSTDAENIARAPTTEFAPAELFSALLREDESYFNETARVLAVDRSALAFIAYCSLRPSLSYCADRLSDLRREWEKGYCPICGHLPGIAILDEAGRRFLSCSFCWHQWPFARSSCPFCETRRPDAGKYLYSESEKDLRVELCESCGRYIKTVDMRTAHRPVYPALEQVASLHLDLLARKQGYESGAQLPLEVGGRP